MWRITLGRVDFLCSSLNFSPVALNYAPKAHNESEVEIRQPILRLRSSGERAGRHGKKSAESVPNVRLSALKSARMSFILIVIHRKVGVPPGFSAFLLAFPRFGPQHCESDKANPVESGSDGFNTD